MKHGIGGDDLDTVQHDCAAAERLKRISEGSLIDLERLYVQYSKFVQSIAQQYISDPMEAEDVCHDVFMEVMKKATQFDSRRGSVEAWLTVITKSRCLDRLRRKRRYLLESMEGDLWWDHGEGLVEEAVVSKLERDRIKEAMRQIPLHQQKAVIGAYYDHRTHQELSELMNRPLGTVKSLIRSGIRNIRKQIAQENAYDPQLVEHSDMATNRTSSGTPL